MSCQQASRLTDDPYAFTEPTTIIQTGSIYQSSLLNREKKITSNSIVGGSQPISAVSVNYSNGVINKNSTIYTQTIAKQQRSQQQPLTFHSAFSKQIQQHTVKSPATTNKSLLATGKSVKLVKPASNLPQQINQNVLKTNLVVPDNNSKRNIINHSSNNSHSSTPSSSSSDVPVVSPPLNAHLILGNTAYSPNYKNQIQPIAKLQKTDSTNLSLGGQTGSSNIFVQQSFTPTSSIIPVTHNTALLPTVNTFKTTIASPKSFLQTPISVKASEVSNGHNNITFAMPKQQNGKSGVHVPSSGHKLSSVMKITPVAGIVNNPPIPITGQSGKSTTSGKRGKRSYSNTSHNETVQRISESSDSMLATGSGKMKIKPVIAIPVKREWHAPDSYVYDYTSPHASIEGCLETSSLVQNNWFIANFAPVTVNVKAEELCPPQQGISSQLQSDSIVNKSVNSDNLLNKLTRDERLQIKRANLRRKAVQYWSGQNLRNNLASKRRLINAWKVFSKLEQQRIDSEKEPLSYNTIDEFPSNKCSIENCKQKPLVMTSFCYQHITCNTEQRLFHSCTAKFSDNTQCRVPVFDISHELPLCTEHAWKRDNYNKMLQEMKPKKPPRKKPKPSAMTRPSKRNKKKKKIQPQNHQPILPPPPQYSTLYPNYNKITPSGQMKLENDLLPGLVVQNNSNDTINMYHPQTQDFLSICENSSAYASSEDTGVGGLSESELMVAQDVIENIPFIETHELTNVLNQIPADAFHELFSEQQNTFEPTQEEQDHLDFVLEAVDKHVKNLEQMTEESTNFLGDFLDNVDEEMLNTDICTDQILQTC